MQSMPSLVYLITVVASLIGAQGLGEDVLEALQFAAAGAGPVGRSRDPVLRLDPGSHSGRETLRVSPNV